MDKPINMSMIEALLELRPWKMNHSDLAYKVEMIQDLIFECENEVYNKNQEVEASIDVDEVPF